MTDPDPDVIPDAEPLTPTDPDAPIDWSAIRAETVDAFPDAQGTPDHKASRPRRSGRSRSFLGGGKPAGDKADPPKSTRAASKPKIPNRKGQFIEPIGNLYAYVGLGLMPFDPVCGNAVMVAAPKCAEALDELAYRNDAVRRVLWSLVNTSAMGAVIAAHLPILMAVVMHHVPAVQGMMGGMGAAFADGVADQMKTDAEARVYDPDDDNGGVL